MNKNFIFICLMLPFALFGQNVPRKIIALYDSNIHRDLYFTKTHQLAEMPLNHLGYIFEYHDIRRELPDLGDREDVVGVIAWFDEETQLSLDVAKKLFDWSLRSLDLGKKFLLMGQPIFIPENTGLPLEKMNTFWEKLGLRITGDWVAKTYSVKLVEPHPYMTGFERSYKEPYDTYVEVLKTSDKTTSYLSAIAEGREYPKSVLMAIAPNGGYVANDYAVFFLFEEGKSTRKWYINPFLFFQKVFDRNNIPKPDTTTIAGRRIYYSQIDGDGWNNQTEIKEYPFGTISARVLAESIIEKYPDLPVTVGPIAADVDPDWVALSDSRAEAKKIFSLPNVEVGCHTFTHPFDWEFFKDYKPADEIPFLSRYPNGSWLGKGFIARVRSAFEGYSFFTRKDTTVEDEEVKGKKKEAKAFDDSYSVPRAYALKPFNLELEVKGAIKYIDALAPKGKKVALYQWSGNCRPFYAALKDVIQSGVMNINGGDTRFDNVYASYGWVAPLGREVRDLRQIYSSNANENLYTNLWRSDFFGFNILPQTFKNTEIPIRIRPMDVYYHVYSAQKYPSLKAVQQNLDYVKTQNPSPVRTSEFSSIVYGFYSADIVQKDRRAWEFQDRGDLQTIRFDRATLESVDFSKSQGVIGQRYLQGSLYVYLDSKIDNALIALKDNKNYFSLPGEPLFYLIESRWQISNLQRSGQGIEFTAAGFGPGEMTWNVPSEGKYEVSVDKGENLLAASKNRKINFVINQSAIEPVSIKIRGK